MWIKRLIYMYGKSSKYITGFQNTTAHVFVLWVMLIRVFWQTVRVSKQCFPSTVLITPNFDNIWNEEVLRQTRGLLGTVTYKSQVERPHIIYITIVIQDYNTEKYRNNFILLIFLKHRRTYIIYMVCISHGFDLTIRKKQNK